MKILKTTNTNEDILIDDDTFEVISEHNWTKTVKGYIVRYTGGSRKSNRQIVWLHKFIMGAKKGEPVDHINRNKLDNRKCNLRRCSIQTNSFNSISKGGNSKYKGVHIRKSGRCQAAIMYNYSSIHLGHFASEINAAKAYDRAAIKYFGEFAYTNFDRSSYGNL